MIEFTRRNDDPSFPKSIMVHESEISSFIFKAIDLERICNEIGAHGGLLMKALTENVKDPEIIRKIVDRHFELMRENLK